MRCDYYDAADADFAADARCARRLRCYATARYAMLMSIMLPRAA